MRDLTASRRLHSEEGAVAVLTAITLFALFATTALALDIGTLWVNRRVASAQADSAALAAVVEFRETGTCSTALASVAAVAAVAADGGDATQTSADASCYPSSAKVAVEHRYSVNLAFAGIFGVDASDVYARSVAEYGNVATLSGLRPIGLCSESPQYQSYFAGTQNQGPADGQTTFATATGIAHRIDFTQQSVGSPGCNPFNVPGAGNWGWLDFDGNGNAGSCQAEGSGGGSSELDDRLEGGYDCGVTADLDGYLAGSDAADCQPAAGTDNCPPATGANASTKSILSDLQCPNTATDPASECEVLWILIYDVILSAGGGGSGVNLRYHPVGFAPVVLRDFNKVTGVGGGNAASTPSSSPGGDFVAAGSAIVAAAQGNSGGNNGGGNNGGGNNGGGGGGGGSSDGSGLCTPASAPNPDNGWFCFEFLDIQAPGSIGPPIQASPVVRTFTAIHLCGAETTDLCALPDN